MTRRKGTPKAVLAEKPGLPPFPVRIAFLQAYERIGTVTGAADAVGIHRSKHYDWLKESGPHGDAYRRSFADAHAKSVEIMEEEARHRAIEGEWELVTHNGNPVMVGFTASGAIVPEDDPQAVGRVAVRKKKKSDALLIFLLKGGKPEKYAERRQVELGGMPGQPIQVEATVEERTDRFSEGFWKLLDLSGAQDVPAEGGAE